MSELVSVLDRARAERRGPMIAYLPAGFPDFQTSVDAAVALSEAGVDALEFGVPYSDPVMDGPVIQAACQRALQAGFHVDQLFRAIEQVRSRVDMPIVVMGYYNLMHARGVDNFARDLKNAGGAGMVTPDLIPEEAGEWLTASDKYDLDRIFLAAPTSSDERLRKIIEVSRGFVYTVSTMGITGARADVDRAARILAYRLHDLGCERACVGIGISTADQVRDVLGYAEGAIVGSALVRSLAEGGVTALSTTATELVRGTER